MNTQVEQPFMRRALSLLIAFSVLVGMLGGAASAFALEGAKVTIDQQEGGLPTRFTFEGTVEKGAGQVPQVTFVFPKGFDLTKARTDSVVLEGLKRVPVSVRQRVNGERLVLSLQPPVAEGSLLRVQIHDVVTTNEGKEYTLQATYQTASGSKPVPGLTFSYESPTPAEVLSRALGQKAWVQSWNKSKVLSIFFRPQLIVTSIPLLFYGLLYSISLVLIAFPLAITGGLGIAFMKMSKIWPVRWIAAAYINVIRGTPLFLQIAIAFIGLRIAGVRVPDFATAIIVLALNSSAYLAEIFRAGIQSIHKGQLEAASSLGMTYWQAMQYVVIPQTVKRVLPTMTSEFILLFKDTALFSAFGIIELMYRANSIVSRTGNLTPFVVAAVGYLIITIPLINWVGSLERRLAVAEGGGAADDNEKKKRGFFGLGKSHDGTASDELPQSTRHESR